MDPILLTGSPWDDQGRLAHRGDAAAQLCLAFRRLESAVVAIGRRTCQLDELRAVTTDADALAGALEVLLARLDAAYAAPRVTVVPVARLAVPGQIVTLETLLRAGGELSAGSAPAPR